jgi:hypothetical protein
MAFETVGGTQPLDTPWQWLPYACAFLFFIAAAIMLYQPRGAFVTRAELSPNDPEIAYQNAILNKNK